MEEKSIVLLKNSPAVLPIVSSKIHSIAIIGGHADVGMISGGGSAQVDPPGGNAIMPPGKGATIWQKPVWFPTSPLKALQAKLPNTKIDFDPGTDAKSAASLAKSADLAIVFAYQWESEDMDVPSLSLPDNQDALIEQVASANPHTIVVLETGTAVTMPWIDKVAGVVEAWYAGSSGHKALADILVGDINPSGKLPLTFTRSEEDLPHPEPPKIPAESQAHAGDVADNGAPSSNASAHTGYAVHYDEGAAIGYKWFEEQHKKPLFAFGFGLSYTTYAYSGLSVDAGTKTARFTVKNTGKRPGIEIAEVYGQLPIEYRRALQAAGGMDTGRTCAGRIENSFCSDRRARIEDIRRREECLEYNTGGLSSVRRWIVGQYAVDRDFRGSLRSVRRAVSLNLNIPTRRAGVQR